MLSRLTSDRAARWLFLAITLACCLLAPTIGIGLLAKSRPVLLEHGLGEVLLSSRWQPLAGRFGLQPFIAGTACVTGLAMLLAVPPSLLAAIYLAEYASPRARRAVEPLIDLLAGIPSVIFGVWGIIVVVPAVTRLSAAMGSFSSGYSWLAGSLVLALMVCPFIVHLSHEVLRAVPAGLREAALSLGATRWETARLVVVRRAFPGIVAAVVLGFSRALGETIAVLMVVGNVAETPGSLFEPIYPLPALLANNYGEMMSIPLYDSALMLAALALLVVVVVFNVAARASLNLVQRSLG